MTKQMLYGGVLGLALLTGLSACTDPYDPAQRTVGGGLLGAATGAAIRAAVGGGPGAPPGAAVGGGGLSGGGGELLAVPRPPRGRRLRRAITRRPAVITADIRHRRRRTEAIM